MGGFALKLHFGCGKDILPDYVNVDIRYLPGVDMIFNLNNVWPWESNSVSEIRAFHLLEHLPNTVKFMDEAWRILKPGGLLHVKVPHHRHRNSDTDPTHIRRFTENSMDYFYPETSFEPLSNLKWYGKRKVHGGIKVPVLDHVFLTPPYEIEWELTPIK